MTIRTPQFQPSVIDEHYAFLDRLKQQGKLELAGSFTDKSGGAYLIKAANLEEARTLAFSDPVYHFHSCKNPSLNLAHFGRWTLKRIKLQRYPHQAILHHISYTHQANPLLLAHRKVRARSQHRQSLTLKAQVSALFSMANGLVAC